MGTDSIWEKGESKAKIGAAVGGLVLILCSYLILYTINPNLTLIRIGVNKVEEGEWPDIEMGDGGAQYITNGELRAGATTKKCPEGFVKADVFIACKSIAANIEKMVADAKKEGIILGGGGFRTQEQQIALRKQNCAGDVWSKPSTSCKPPTARPGFSRHESGHAFDLTCDGKTIVTKDNKCFIWLQKNAVKYGLKNFSLEPWHWSTDGN